MSYFDEQEVDEACVPIELLLIKQKWDVLKVYTEKENEFFDSLIKQCLDLVKAKIHQTLIVMESLENENRPSI